VVPLYNVILWFTAELVAELNEVDQMLADTEHNNTTQNSNYHISFDIFLWVVRLYSSSLQHIVAVVCYYVT